MSLLSSNWAKLQQKQPSRFPKKKPAAAAATTAPLNPLLVVQPAAASASASKAGGGGAKHNKHSRDNKSASNGHGKSPAAATTNSAAGAAAATAAAPELTTHVALDCEMVGVGRDGFRSALARCSIVNSDGHVLFDRYVEPVEAVTDYRTHVSGVEPRHLDRTQNPELIDFQSCRARVTQLIAGRTVVGHSLKNDWEVLLLDHPSEFVRDTATYRPLCPHRPRALRTLVQEGLGIEIHKHSHDSVEDARCVMALYRKHRKQWEQTASAKTRKRKLADHAKQRKLSGASIGGSGMANANAANSAVTTTTNVNIAASQAVITPASVKLAKQTAAATKAAAVAAAKLKATTAAAAAAATRDQPIDDSDGGDDAGGSDASGDDEAPVPALSKASQIALALAAADSTDAAIASGTAIAPFRTADRHSQKPHTTMTRAAPTTGSAKRKPQPKAAPASVAVRPFKRDRKF